MITDDNNIVSTIKDNPELGFRMLMKKYKEPIYWHIRRLVVSHDDAQDATQESFVRIFKAISQFKGDSSFKTWIYRIATNEALRIISKRNNTLSLDDEEVNLSGLLTDEYVDYGDLETVKLQKAILSLPTKQQTTFNLRYYDEMSYEEIAEITGSTAVNVKANYHVAKEKIIKFMNSND